MDAREGILGLLDSYVRDSVSIRIVDLAGPAQKQVNRALSFPQTFTFKLEIANNGLVTMRNVEFSIQGTEFVEILDAPTLPMSLAMAITPRPLDIPARSTFVTEKFTARTRAVTNGQRPVLTVNIVSWDAEIAESLLKGHDGGGEAPAELRLDISEASSAPNI